MDGALLETMRTNPGLGRAPFDEMLRGMRDDAGAVRYERFRPELLQYCYRVAGTVGEMLLPVLALEEEKEGAIALGCAIQLLNICRDVRTDLLDRGRIYLPREDMARCGISEEECAELIRAGNATPQLRRLVRMQARRASALLGKAEESISRVPKSQATLIAVIVDLHRALLAELASRGYDNLSGQRVRVGTAQKLTLTAGTVASVYARGPSGHVQAAIAKRRSRGASMMAAVDEADADYEAEGQLSSEGQLPSWSALADALPSSRVEPPSVFDSVLRRGEEPSWSRDRPTLFRERHGWCPYSERVYLALELKGIAYDTVLIDNTGGGRPSYFSGSTPQMRWGQSGRTQSESLDLLRALDQNYPETPPLWPPADVEAGAVSAMVSAFKATFPRNSRPSSRAAYLFSYEGGALPRSTFEATLQRTEELLGEESSGPFFCGAALSAADVAWAPFLERYAAQLPCLHDDLRPRDPATYPKLAAWFTAMEALPAYACRVEGNAASWRKVLSMAGYGNAGTPPNVLARMDEAAADEAFAASAVSTTWADFARTRPHVAASASMEAACIIVRNNDAILSDAAKRRALGADADQEALDAALRAVATLLATADGDASSSGGVEELATEAARCQPGAGALAAFLDDRLCCPRDMGAPAAAALKRLAGELGWERR